MARKKAPPKRAPEYVTGKVAKPKKKSPPGRAKDGSQCFTRTNKGGGTYVTCKGTQGDSKATKASRRPAGQGGKAKRTGGAPGKAKASTKRSPPSAPKISKAEFTNARANLTKTLARKPGTKPKPARSIGSYADSDATRRSTRPKGEGGFAKRTGGAPGRFTSNPTGNKPKGMSMDEWRTRPSYREPTGYQGPRMGQSEADSINEFLGVGDVTPLYRNLSNQTRDATLAVGRSNAKISDQLAQIAAF